MSKRVPCRRCDREGREQPVKHTELSDGRLRCSVCALTRYPPTDEPEPTPKAPIGGNVSELSAAEKREIDKLARRIEDAIRHLSSITRVHLGIIVRRREISSEIDGHASNKRAKAGGGSSKSSSTEAAALSGLPGEEEDDFDRDDWSKHTRRDEQGGAIEAFFDALLGRNLDHPGALDQIATARSSMLYIVHTGDRERGRQDTGTVCVLCDGRVSNTLNDRILGDGYGPRCYGVWKRKRPQFLAKYGADAKLRFKGYREEEFAQGKPRCGEVKITKTVTTSVKIPGVEAHIVEEAS